MRDARCAFEMSRWDESALRWEIWHELMWLPYNSGAVRLSSLPCHASPHQGQLPRWRWTCLNSRTIELDISRIAVKQFIYKTIMKNENVNWQRRLESQIKSVANMLFNCLYLIYMLVDSHVVMIILSSHLVLSFHSIHLSSHSFIPNQNKATLPSFSSYHANPNTHHLQIHP